MLGRNQVESILIGTAARASVPSPRSAIFDSGRFWHVAASRALIATSISAIIEPARRSETFTAALLQDMALPVLVDEVDGYELLLKRWYDGDVTNLAEAEEALYGWDHASVAARMATSWEFPQPLMEAIAQHHEHDDDASMLGVRLVASWHEIDLDQSKVVLLEHASKVPALANHDCEHLVEEALSRVGEVAALFT
jgi:HD-like signal output (HDOD) protein